MNFALCYPGVFCGFNKVKCQVCRRIRLHPQKGSEKSHRQNPKSPAPQGSFCYWAMLRFTARQCRDCFVDELVRFLVYKMIDRYGEDSEVKQGEIFSIQLVYLVSKFYSNQNLIAILYFLSFLRHRSTLQSRLAQNSKRGGITGMSHYAGFIIIFVRCRALYLCVSPIFVCGCITVKIYHKKQVLVSKRVLQ